MNYSALIGKPTQHSISPIMYEEIARAADIDEEYKHLKINVEADQLRDTIDAFRLLGFIGLNVTQPYKVDVIEYLDEVDDTVHQIGAVNTIRLHGATTGFNTDWVGIYKSVTKAQIPTIDSVTVLGTGGAARAAIFAARKLDVDKINVLRRSAYESKNTHDLIQKRQELGITIVDYSVLDTAVEESQLIINATSAGMIGKDLLPFNLGDLTAIDLADKFFLDAVYNPLITPLIEFFKSRGAYTVDGLWMMIYQGLGAMSAWLDRDVSIDDGGINKIHDMLAKRLRNS